MLNNWRRRSKRWRKSFDGDSDKSVVDELDSQLAKVTIKNNGTDESVEFTDAAQATLRQTCLLKERIEITTTNVDTLADNLSKNNINSQGNLCPQDISERPQSLLLFSKHSTNLDREDLKNRALSEGDITEGNSKLPSPVWVRQTEERKKRSTSLSHLQQNVSLQRSSIEFIDNGSPISTSKGSLLDTSQDSLVDSGVSTEDSPTNTLSCMRTNKFIKSSSAANSSGESSIKLTGLNIGNWSEWVDSEMGQTPANHKEPTESSPDCKVTTKSHNRFKNVVKQLFSAKKRYIHYSLFIFMFIFYYFDKTLVLALS